MAKAKETTATWYGHHHTHAHNLMIIYVQVIWLCAYVRLSNFRFGLVSPSNEELY